MIMRLNILMIIYEFEKNKVKCIFNIVVQCGERLVDSRFFFEFVFCSFSGFCFFIIEIIEKYYYEKYQFVINERL